MVEEPDFDALVARARSGDRDAFGQVCDRVRPYLMAVASAGLELDLQGKESSQDLVQDSFVEAQKLLDRFEGGTLEELRAWMAGIVSNKLRDFRRRYRYSAKRQVNRERSTHVDGKPRQDLISTGSDGETPSSAIRKAEEKDRVVRALARLPDEYQMAIRLRTWDGLTFAAVGQVLDRSEDAARMLWARAIERLKHELRRLP